jgi:hypothetical protein
MGPAAQYRPSRASVRNVSIQVQGDWPVHSTVTLASLDDYIKGCDLVIPYCQRAGNQSIRNLRLLDEAWPGSRPRAPRLAESFAVDQPGFCCTAQAARDRQQNFADFR